MWNSTATCAALLFTFKMTLQAKACWENWKEHRVSALMHALPHFPQADNINEGWHRIIKGEKSNCKQCLSKQTLRRVSHATIYSWSGIKTGQIITNKMWEHLVLLHAGGAGCSRPVLNITTWCGAEDTQESWCFNWFNNDVAVLYCSTCTQ